jgi:hypothetical protein
MLWKLTETLLCCGAHGNPVLLWELSETLLCCGSSWKSGFVVRAIGNLALLWELMEIRFCYSNVIENLGSCNLFLM